MSTQTLENQIEHTRRLDNPEPQGLVLLSLTPQWAEVVRQLQTMNNGKAAAAVVQFHPLKVGCVIAFEDARR